MTFLLSPAPGLTETASLDGPLNPFGTLRNQPGHLPPFYVPTKLKVALALRASEKICTEKLLLRL